MKSWQNEGFKSRISIQHFDYKLFNKFHLNIIFPRKRIVILKLQPKTPNIHFPWCNKTHQRLFKRNLQLLCVTIQSYANYANFCLNTHLSIENVNNAKNCSKHWRKLSKILKMLRQKRNLFLPYSHRHFWKNVCLRSQEDFKWPQVSASALLL